MEDHLVSELFRKAADDDEDFKIVEAKQPSVPISRKRQTIAKDFFNEILHSDDEDVMDEMKRSKHAKMFDRGRELCAQELNITHIVGAIRVNHYLKQMLKQQWEAAHDCEISDEQLNSLVQRRITMQIEGEDKYKTGER